MGNYNEQDVEFVKKYGENSWLQYLKNRMSFALMCIVICFLNILAIGKDDSFLTNLLGGLVIIGSVYNVAILPLMELKNLKEIYNKLNNQA